MTCIVRFEPLGKQVAVPAGTSVLSAARLAGVPLGASCDGDGVCAACGVKVLAGDPTREGPLERRSKAANGTDPTLRLACLLPVRGPLTVTTTYW
jgi:2Fe-2S ferredoxin